MSWSEMESTVKNFHHPYKPYDIQFELMNVVYQCIVEGKVGILESPTGLPPQNFSPGSLI